MQKQNIYVQKSGSIRSNPVQSSGIIGEKAETAATRAPQQYSFPSCLNTQACANCFSSSDIAMSALRARGRFNLVSKGIHS